MLDSVTADSSVLVSRSSKVTDVILPKPPLGGKIWLMEAKGIFVLERGPATLRTIACTHAGSGAILAYDGVPSNEGFFPDEGMPVDHPNYWLRNGRPIYRANPVVMGSWMCDGGTIHGLTIVHTGGTDSTSAVASIVWVAFGQAVPKAP